MYVKRDEQGRLIAVSLNPEPGFTQEDGQVGGEMAAFLTSSRNNAELLASDLEFVRVVDDLLEALMAKGVINFTDLPTQAQEKFLNRSRLRERSRGALDLLDDEGLV